MLFTNIFPKKVQQKEVLEMNNTPPVESIENVNKKILLSPIAYKICRFIHNAGGKSVLFNLTEFVKLHNNSFTISACSAAIKKIAHEGILKVEEYKWFDDSKRAGKPSPIITLCFPFESLEPSFIRRSDTRTDIKNNATTPLPKEPHQTEPTDTDTLDLLTKALVERQELREKIPQLENLVAELLKKNEDLRLELENQKNQNQILTEKFTLMRDKAVKREELLARYLGTTVKTVRLDMSSGLVEKIT